MIARGRERPGHPMGGSPGAGGMGEVGALGGRLGGGAGREQNGGADEGPTAARVRLRRRSYRSVAGSLAPSPSIAWRAVAPSSPSIGA
jgi:hypothetical protein